MRPQYLLFGIISLIMLSILSSCAAFEDPSKKATANAEDTAIAATISVVEFQNETMVALRQTADAGVALSQQMTQSAGNSVNTNPNNNTNSNLSVTNIPAVDGGVPQGNLPTPSRVPPPATSTPATANYSYATITDELDDAFCDLNDVDTFDLATVDTIYFVVYVQQLKPGVNFSLRIENLSGGLAATDPNFWTSDAIYDSTCIYYGIDAETMGGSFNAGSYKAILQANGAEAGSDEFYIVSNQ